MALNQDENRRATAAVSGKTGRSPAALCIASGAHETSAIERKGPACSINGKHHGFQKGSTRHHMPGGVQDTGWRARRTMLSSIVNMREERCRETCSEEHDIANALLGAGNVMPYRTGWRGWRHVFDKPQLFDGKGCVAFMLEGRKTDVVSPIDDGNSGVVSGNIELDPGVEDAVDRWENAGSGGLGCCSRVYLETTGRVGRGVRQLCFDFIEFFQDGAASRATATEHGECHLTGQCQLH